MLSFGRRSLDMPWTIPWSIDCRCCGRQCVSLTSLFLGASGKVEVCLYHTYSNHSTMSEVTHPSDDKDIEKVFNFPFLTDDVAVEFLKDHGRVFFIVRGLPGTGKSVLSTMLQDQYPEHKIYWADKMFLTPVPVQRTPENLRESHRLCYEKIEGFMKKNSPVIINRNSNVRLSEVAKFLLLAAKYGYTVIFADTSYKFSITPEELAATNTKRLTLDYMKKRCRQWESIYPIYTGWFLSPTDALLLSKYFSNLVELMNESVTGWTLPKVLHTEGHPFCLGRRCWFALNPSEKEYCDSKEVKDAYGTVHELNVVGYAIIQELAVAVVILDEHQIRLLGHREIKDDDESVSDLLSELSISDWKPTHCQIQLSDVVDSDEDTLSGSDRVENIFASDTVSFIILGSCSKDPKVPFVTSKDLPMLWKRLCKSISITHHGVECQEKISVDDVTACRANQDYLILDKRVQLCGVFTGYYQPYKMKDQTRCRYFQASGRCKFGDSCLYLH